MKRERKKEEKKKKKNSCSELFDALSHIEKNCRADLFPRFGSSSVLSFSVAVLFLVP